MTKYEELLSEYEGVVNVEERTMINEGLYCDGYIWIKQDLNNHRKACVLAEEIGHHYTSVGDITNLKNIGNRKQEHVARKWAFEKLVPLHVVKNAIAQGHSDLWDMAEFLDIDEEFLCEALKYYGFL